MIYILKSFLDLFCGSWNSIPNQNTQDPETVSWQNSQNHRLLVGEDWPFLLILLFLKSYSYITDLTDKL